MIAPLDPAAFSDAEPFYSTLPTHNDPVKKTAKDTTKREQNQVLNIYELFM